MLVLRYNNNHNSYTYKMCLKNLQRACLSNDLAGYKMDLVKKWRHQDKSFIVTFLFKRQEHTLCKSYFTIKALQRLQNTGSGFILLQRKYIKLFFLGMLTH